MKYIIATHGYLADGYVSSIQVLTKKNNIYAVNAYVDDRDAALQLKTIIESFENQEEIIIFTDLMCGSMTQHYRNQFTADSGVRTNDKHH